MLHTTRSWSRSTKKTLSSKEFVPVTKKAYKTHKAKQNTPFLEAHCTWESLPWKPTGLQLPQGSLGFLHWNIWINELLNKWTTKRTTHARTHERKETGIYCTYLVAVASIRDRTYCPQQAKNCSVYSEWNCFKTVIIPTTNGALSIWSVGRLATIVPGAREQV